jgi:putative alpha-1,2-mannosidase
MNMMGFYPVSPSSGNYTIGSPMFAKVTIDVGGSTPFVITAKNQSPDNMYVQSLTWNGNAVTGTEISYADMMEGGKLEFTMGSKPAWDIANGEL